MTDKSELIADVHSPSLPVNKIHPMVKRAAQILIAGTVATDVANTYTESQTLANAKSLIFKELTVNGTGSVAIKAPDSSSGNTAYVATLQAATGTIALSADVSAVADDVAHLVTLSGVAVDADSLGTFTGATIADSSTVKAALQAIETALEAQKPSHVIKFAGKHTVTAGEDSAEVVAKTISGVAATDLVFVQFEVADASSVILKVAPTTNTITITGTLKENDIICYQVLRALA